MSRRPEQTRLSILVSVLLVAALGLAAPRADAADIVGRLEAYYKSIKGYTASFAEEVTLPGASAPMVQKGRVRIQIPSRLRWDYDDPEKSDIVIDGEKVWVIQSKRDEALYWKMEEDRSSPVAYQFLLGVGDIEKSFDVKPQEIGGGAWRLGLAPKGGLSSVQQLALEVEGTSPRIRAVEMKGAMGESVRLVFRDFEEVERFPPETFQYRPGPKTRVRDAMELLTLPGGASETPP
ncbi:MAG: outer membrane lipoprotein carrier protein LolA [Nitrospirae bacterium]|nr:outer membrane lipoprotein carrier protein LolA [Nitrospirota bacterium]